jgi:hypothetical protein
VFAKQYIYIYVLYIVLVPKINDARETIITNIQKEAEDNKVEVFPGRLVKFWR